MSAGHCTDPTRTGTNFPLTISLGDNGAVSVSTEDQTGVCVNDTLTFTCADHPWAVQFIGEGKPKSPSRQNAPLYPLAVAGAAGESGVITVQTDASTGKQWDYVVAVYANDRIYTVDPDIVIGDRR